MGGHEEGGRERKTDEASLLQLPQPQVAVTPPLPPSSFHRSNLSPPACLPRPLPLLPFQVNSRELFSVTASLALSRIGRMSQKTDGKAK